MTAASRDRIALALILGLAAVSLGALTAFSPGIAFVALALPVLVIAGLHPEGTALVLIPLTADVTRPGGFPTAVAEAMASGKTLIVGIGERTEFLPLHHRQDALLVPPSDAQGILAAVLELAGDRELAGRLGDNVGRFARENMDYPVVAVKYLELLRGLVHG